jgi:hypothetical protein
MDFLKVACEEESEEPMGREKRHCGGSLTMAGKKINSRHQ